jgi:arylsulfatase A-like enzyme
MNWTHGHNGTIHNGISRIGFYTGGNAARFRDEDLADKWVEQTKIFVKENKEKPFFLFFAAHDIHVPRTPHERFQGKSGTGLRGDSVLQLDWCVGEIIATLAEHDLTENTLILFCSDNGSIKELGKHEPSGNLTGGKYTVFEAGTRTPFITYWPKTIPPGTSEQIVCTIDLPASFAELTKTTPPAGSFRDSENILPALLGKPNAKGRESLVQQDNGTHGKNSNFGLRSGDWKLIRATHKFSWGATVSKKNIPEIKSKHALYYLPDDPSESNDLSQQNPEKTQELITLLNSILNQ